MKLFLFKTIAFIIIAQVLFLKASHAQGVFFADGAFHSLVSTKYPSCVFQADGSINTTCSEILNEDSLDLSGIEILDYDGLQYFPSLRYLDVSNNPLFPPWGGWVWPFPVAPYTNLKVFKCQNNIDFNWPYFPNLEYLDFSNTVSGPLQSVPPAFPPTLKYLNCSGNSIFGILNVPPLLDTLICKDNGYYFSVGGGYTGITSFSSLPATLRYLDCSGNVLGGLPALPASLTFLDCTDNRKEISSGPDYETVGGIGSLPSLPPNLKHLACGENRISNLPALPSALEYLSCAFPYSGGLGSLPALPVNLRTLNVSGNNLSSLSALPDSLRYLNCSSNSSLRCLPYLPPFLNTLLCGNTLINCIPNTVSSLTTSTITTLCNPVNNSNQCAAYPVVSGYIFYDNNSNGIKEPSENYRANVGIQLSNGLQTYSNSNGYYNITADTGLNILTPAPPNYYNVVPATVNITMPTFSSTASQDIALQPAVNVDSVAVSVIPAWFARPGFDQGYDIDYENVGTTVISPSTVFNYDSTRLTFISASNPAVVNNGNSLSLTETNFTPGQHSGYSALFNVKPSAIAGDTIFVNITATAGSATVRDSSYTVITASFDPNDKYATPRLTPQQVAVGNYIDYLVRFQNTGTDTAFNIVITDDLDSKLNASSLQMINTSHPCKVTRIGSNLTFEFLNILLPDSNVNGPASHGYIRFRVKPQPAVIVNDVIPNMASIYFDYNSPILTNTANTLIQLTTVPLHLLSFKAFVNSDNEVLLYWNTENELNTMSFEIEQSTDGRSFDKTGGVTARGHGNNSYSYKTILFSDIVYYRLKIIDIDGRSVYSSIIQARKIRHSESIVLSSNPVKNMLSVVVTDRSLVNSPASIINEHGSVVKRIVLGYGLQNINVGNLSSGLYYLTTAGVSKKVIIKH